MSKKRILAGCSMALIVALAFSALVVPVTLAQDTSGLASCDPSVQALVWAARDAYGYNVNAAMTAPMSADTTEPMDDSDDGEDDDAEATPEATEGAKLTNIAKVPTGVQQDATEEPTDDSDDDDEDMDDMDASADMAMTVNCDAIRADVIAFVYAANGMSMGGGTGMTSAVQFMVDDMAITPNFHVLLSGPQEVPGPGDDDAIGEAWVSVDATTNMVCWNILVAGMNLPASAAHIHTGAEGESGPPVVPLSAPGIDGVAAGCAEADPAVIAAILANPSGHYVNVHNADFPDGATRGQLLGL